MVVENINLYLPQPYDYITTKKPMQCITWVQIWQVSGNISMVICKYFITWSGWFIVEIKGGEKDCQVTLQTRCKL